MVTKLSSVTYLRWDHRIQIKMALLVASWFQFGWSPPPSRQVGLKLVFEWFRTSDKHKVQIGLLVTLSCKAKANLWQIKMGFPRLTSPLCTTWKMKMWVVICIYLFLFAINRNTTQTPEGQTASQRHRCRLMIWGASWSATLVRKRGQGSTQQRCAEIYKDKQMFTTSFLTSSLHWGVLRSVCTTFCKH